MHINYLTVCILSYVLYNAIVHEVITSGRSVQSWYNLVGILTKVHTFEVHLDVDQRSRVNFGIFPCRLVCIPYVLYNAIVQVITSGRSVQLWYSLVGILIIDQASYL